MTSLKFRILKQIFLIISWREGQIKDVDGMDLDLDKRMDKESTPAECKLIYY